MLGKVRGAAIALVVISVLGSGGRADGDPVVDFFSKLGHSMSKAGKHQPAQKATSKHTATHGRGEKTQPGASPGASASASPAMIAATMMPQPQTQAPPASTTTPIPVRAATSAGERASNRDVPYGVPVPNRSGFVTSPYAPNQGYVDVRGLPSGAEVKDPFTGKIFRIP